MLDKPEQSLPGAAELRHLVEDEGDGFLDTAVGILLKPVAGLDEADWRGNDEFAASRLLVSGRQGTLAQKIEFVLVEAALQPQQKPVVALARRIDHLLIDQYGIDDAAHLDELLPVAAIAGKPRHLPRRNRPDLAETDLGDHPVETGTSNAAGGRTSEIIIYRLDARPAERRRRSPIAYCRALLSRLCRT
jgi:hypothetical protein